MTNSTHSQNACAMLLRVHLARTFLAFIFMPLLSYICDIHRKKQLLSA